MEAHFNIHIGRPYRRWQEIARRKRLAVTKYVDDMRDKIIKRLDEEDSK